MGSKSVIAQLRGSRHLVFNYLLTGLLLKNLILITMIWIYSRSHGFWIMVI